jgi:hypothetical protein
MDEDLGQLCLLGHPEDVVPRHLTDHLGMILPNVRLNARDQLVVGFAAHRVATLAVDYFRHVSPFVVEGHRRVGP